MHSKKSRQKSKKGISRLLQISSEKKYLLFLSGFFSVCNALLMLVPYLASFLILKEFIIHYHDFKNIDKILIFNWGIVAIVCIVLALACAYIGFVLSHFAAYKIVFDKKIKLISHIGNLPLGFLGKNSIGKIKKTIQENTENIEHFIAHNIPDVIISITTIIGIFAMMSYLSLYLSLAFLVCIFLGFIIQSSFVVGQKSKLIVKKYYDCLEDINTQSIEYFKGIATIKLFGRSFYSFKKFYYSIIDYKNFTLKFTDKMQNGYCIFKIITYSTLSILSPIGVYIYLKNPSDENFILTFLFFIILTPAISSPLMRLLLLNSSLRDCMQGVERIDYILDTPITKEPTAPKIPQSFEVRFDNVSFKYPSSKHYALKNISFSSSGISALVGPSGGGKSTILSLLARFYDTHEGAISIGGVNIADIQSSDLMELISFVFQDNFLFFDSVLENIKISRPNASFEEIQSVCKLAQCDEFIQNLPEKYHTKIGEKGVYLSGGEAQRIVLARALLKDSPILILDEVNSFSDAHNESKIQKALIEISKNKIVFIITHRLYFMEHMDQILVFDKGNITQRGTHKELIKQKGLYKQMYLASMEVQNYHLSNRENHAKNAL